jgi:hypothetical protein
MKRKHIILTFTQHFIACICTIRFVVTAETGVNALTGCTAEVVIWTWAIKFIAEVTTVIHLVASLVTWHAAIVAALEVARRACAQGCEYVLKCQIRNVCSNKNLQCAFWIMWLHTLVGGYLFLRNITPTSSEKKKITRLCWHKVLALSIRLCGVIMHGSIVWILSDVCKSLQLLQTKNKLHCY